MDFHIGFNEVKYPSASKLFKNIPQNLIFTLFMVFMLNHKMREEYGLSTYRKKFVSSYEKDNIFGVQFHPEKSQAQGITLIKNFLNI